MDNVYTLALWDTNPRRAASIKDKLDMFAPEDKETALLPNSPEPPFATHDIVFLSFDECSPLVLSVARTVRQLSESTFILLISDKRSDLSQVFRPSIRPSGVLFHPVGNAQIRDMLGEVAIELERLTSSNDDDAFIFKIEGVLRRIALGDILFFEARNKKISIRTVSQELSYYDTFESLISRVPQYFVRCHRSYLVNSRKIKALHPLSNDIELSSGDWIPCSRSCQKAVKEAISGKEWS